MLDDRQRAAQIAAEIAALGPCLPGTISSRMPRCGNPRCRCRATHTEQAECYRLWLTNDKHLHELEALWIRTAQHAEGWKEI